MSCLLKKGGGLYPRLHIAAVVLAAGEGRRMGGAAKSLIRLQGVPLISRELVALSGAGVDEVVVVTGHASRAVEQQVQPFPVTLVHNESYAEGQAGSVRAGLAALSGTFDAVFIMPSNQPLIAADDLTDLISVFKKKVAGHVVVPNVSGQRGNPLLLDEVAVAKLSDKETALTCPELLEIHPEFVHTYKTDNTHFITDLDTLNDLQLLAAKTGWQLEMPLQDTNQSSAAICAR